MKVYNVVLFYNKLFRNNLRNYCMQTELVSIVIVNLLLSVICKRAYCIALFSFKFNPSDRLFYVNGIFKNI